MKKLISWNVNGLRACVTKGFEDFFKDVDADIFCLQETKLKRDRLTSCLKDIISIGAMPTKKAIREQLCSQRKSR